MNTIELQLTSIDVASTQTRVRLDAAVVAEYAEAMKVGDIFPAVIVYQALLEDTNANAFYMADGFHRYAAHKLAGRQTILAEVREGSRLKALEFALGANHDHGLRRTNLDKRHCVEMALTEFTDWASNRIAAMCKVSNHLVDAVRREVEPKPEHLGILQAERRVGADGKTYKARARATATVPVKVPVPVPVKAMEEPTVASKPSGGYSTFATIVEDIGEQIARLESCKISPHNLRNATRYCAELIQYIHAVWVKLAEENVRLNPKDIEVARALKECKAYLAGFGSTEEN
jgi:uncharacterized ParB-like nuclease family protein